jgi:hypothetical protein
MAPVLFSEITNTNGLLTLITCGILIEVVVIPTDVAAAATVPSSFWNKRPSLLTKTTSDTVISYFLELTAL